MFLNSHTEEYPKKDAQHWIFSSIAHIDDPAFATSSLGATVVSTLRTVAHFLPYSF